MAETITDAPRLFLFTGEGAHSAATDVPSLRASPAWTDVVVDVALRQLGIAESLDALLRGIGTHEAPLSPLITTVINILNAESWRAEGLVQTHVIGYEERSTHTARGTRQRWSAGNFSSFERHTKPKGKKKV